MYDTSRCVPAVRLAKFEGVAITRFTIVDCRQHPSSLFTRLEVP